MGGGWKVFGATHVRLGWSAIEQTYLSPMTGWGHEQTTRTRQSGVCLYSVNRPQSRRKQTLAPVFPKAGPAEAACSRSRAIASRRGLVPETYPRTRTCRAERAKTYCARKIRGPSELGDGDPSCLPGRARLQPRYRGLAHTIGPREIGLRSTFREALDGFLALMHGQYWGPPKTHATGLGTDTAVAGTSNDQCALELRKAAQNGQHQPAVRRRGVRPGVRQRLEAGPGFRNRVEDIEQVARPREWFGKASMQRINVLSIQGISAEDRAKIEAVDPAIELTDAGGWYDGEIRETWPAFTTTRYLAPGAAGSGTREERDRLLAEAEVILGGWPFPLDLRARAPRLRWFHQRPAGASNLLAGDLWGSRVVVTTSRGSGNTLAMAEYAVAGILHFAKGLHRAAVDRGAGVFDHRAYRPLLLEGKTACVVGADGIGLDVGKLCAALGMRVVGTRRHPHPDRPLPPGFSELGGAGDLDRFLPESDFVVICCQWTLETTRLFDKDRFAAMKAGACSSTSPGVRSSTRRPSPTRFSAIICAAQRSMFMSANSSTRRCHGSGPIPGY